MDPSSVNATRRSLASLTRIQIHNLRVRALTAGQEQQHLCCVLSTSNVQPRNTKLGNTTPRSLTAASHLAKTSQCYCPDHLWCLSRLRSDYFSSSVYCYGSCYPTHISSHELIGIRSNCTTGMFFGERKKIHAMICDA